MKTIMKILAGIAVALFIAATIIKFAQKTTYKEAVGIMEELWKECRARCCSCGGGEDAEEEA